MKIIFTLIICFIFNSTNLYAHELWLEAKNYKLKNQEKLIVDIKVGQDLIGESYPFINEETEKLFFQTSNEILQLKQNDGDYPAIQQKIKDPGTQFLYYQSNIVLLEYQDFETFINFTKEYDLEYEKNNKKRPKEIYQRFAKLIFQNEKGNFFQSSQNLEFEIINLNDPYVNEQAKLQVFLDKKPFANQTVIVFFRNNKEFERTKYLTDENGMLFFNASKQGLYLISAVHLEKLNLLKKMKYDADYFSKWASLTFEK